MKILLATDGSDTARAAADFVAAFPLPAGTEVTVTTVIKEVLPGDAVLELTAERRRALEALRRNEDGAVRDLLDGEVRRLSAAGLDANSRIRTGHPAEEIVRLATELQADLIVVGSHGLGGVKRFLLGSVSDRVFEYAPCSVLVVRQPDVPAGHGTTFPRSGDTWRLLLAYDDSPPARSAVEWCTSLPLQGRAEVDAITILPLIRMYRQDIRQQLSWAWHDKKRAARDALGRVTQAFDHRGIQITTELREFDDVAHAILDAAGAFGSDLLIVGHKGKKAFERFLLGSVTARIAHHAPCSVLSVRTRDRR